MWPERHASKLKMGMRTVVYVYNTRNRITKPAYYLHIECVVVAVIVAVSFILIAVRSQKLFQQSRI
jgi:hypothetical protein